jgi:hypothetical protein
VTNNDDEGAARVFGALCDPVALRLLLRVLEAGECDSSVGHQLELTCTAAAAHLELLAGAGLMVRTQPDRGAGVYRISDAALVERLLATVRQLGAGRPDMSRTTRGTPVLPD